MSVPLFVIKTKCAFFNLDVLAAPGVAPLSFTPLPAAPLPGLVTRGILPLA